MLRIKLEKKVPLAEGNSIIRDIIKDFAEKNGVTVDAYVSQEHSVTQRWVTVEPLNGSDFPNELKDIIKGVVGVWNSPRSGFRAM